MALVLVVLTLMLGTPLARDLAFDESYHAEELPEEASPPWRVHGDGALSRVRDGVLEVESKGNSARWYYSIPQSEWLGRAVVEFRFKGGSQHTEDEFFRVELSDGDLRWRVSFYPGRCFGKVVETSQWDTYRLMVHEGRLTLLSRKSGVIVEDLAGSPVDGPARLLFGSYKGGTREKHWSLDFIRWSHDQHLQEPLMQSAIP